MRHTVAEGDIVCEIYNRNKDASSATAEWFADLLSPNPWFRDVVPNVSIANLLFRSNSTERGQFENLLRNNLDEDIESATRFTSVCINTAIYLPWLLSQCCEQGVTFRRGCFQHVREALELDDRKVDIVINCTGLGAARLGGVMDSKLTPARGQIVLVSNDAGGRMMDFSGTDDGADEACYVMSRAAGGGTVLGGSYQKGDWNPNVDHNLAIRIMKRAVKACPALTRGTGKIEDLDVLRHSVGLRPVREGGARVDKERLGEDGSWIVHNYGHGGAGYQCSYGCAEGVLKLVEEIRNSALRLSRL